MLADIILLLFIVLFASTLQTSTGFGFSIIGTPFLLLVYPVHAAIQINMILSICLSASVALKIRGEVDKRLLGRLIIGSSFGLFFGIFVYLYLDSKWLKVIVGLLIMILTLLLIWHFTIKRTRKNDYIASGISGLLTTSIGVPGPPLLLYFSGINMEKMTLRSTTLMYYLFVYSVSLVMQVLFGGTTSEAWLFSLIAIPALFGGIVLGQYLFKWINEAVFRFITYIILIFTSISLLISGWNM